MEKWITLRGEDFKSIVLQVRRAKDESFYTIVVQGTKQNDEVVYYQTTEKHGTLAEAQEAAREMIGEINTAFGWDVKAEERYIV